MLDIDCVYFYLLSKIKSNDEKTVKVKRLRGQDRIGPHNKDILSIIFGSLLGDAHAEKRPTKAGGTRICFQQEHSHRAYLLWLHEFISNLGYCNSKVPAIGTRLGLKGKVRCTARFAT